MPAQRLRQRGKTVHRRQARQHGQSHAELFPEQPAKPSLPGEPGAEAGQRQDIVYPERGYRDIIVTLRHLLEAPCVEQHRYPDHPKGGGQDQVHHEKISRIGVS